MFARSLLRNKQASKFTRHEPAKAKPRHANIKTFHVLRVRSAFHHDELAVRWLELNPPSEPISLDRTVKLAQHGVNQHTAGLGITNSLPVSKGGSTRAYILARLERDGLHQLMALAVRC
jgi:hypothetical protein